ncbi:hypothetical protein RINTU1_35070 [Candidatus Regiella insecticola]|uniref:Uncharacterized protein n=1 Tax=Candidatus Regiella insecticola TaxID=138073 RepID=A0A6L2ZSZ8_9ENTR|nr:hypothetical protein RINTU1_34930 [Candidatus Regiella insecticola]GFN47433.1 hypothetical protein RINTU1_35070 [Candidatus Regiella insecticola]
MADYSCRSADITRLGRINRYVAGRRNFPRELVLQTQADQQTNDLGVPQQKAQANEVNEQMINDM